MNVFACRDADLSRLERNNDVSNVFDLSRLENEIIL